MQGADRINDEFEVGFDQRFERGWAHVEVVGRFVMVAVVGAGLAGLLGRGPYSHKTMQTAESGLAVDFEPIARSQAPTQITFHVDNTTDAATLDLFVGSNTVEPMGLQHVLPEPVATKAVTDGLTLTLAVPPGARNAEIRVMLEPSEIGENELVARLDGHAPIRWTQFVMP